MSSSTRQSRTEAKSTTSGSDPLAGIGLNAGTDVRWQPTLGGRWRVGVVVGLERDGSVAVCDANGGRRSLRIDCLQVRRADRSASSSWEPLSARMSRVEQLTLL